MMLSVAGTAFAGGDAERGQRYLNEARELFSTGSTPDHIQGSGWTWVIDADVGNAGLADAEPRDVVAACDEAIRLLEQIDNWPDIARAYAAKAIALTNLGDTQGAEEAHDRATVADAQSI